MIGWLMLDDRHGGFRWLVYGRLAIDMVALDDWLMNTWWSTLWLSMFCRSPWRSGSLASLPRPSQWWRWWFSFCLYVYMPLRHGRGVVFTLLAQRKLFDFNSPHPHPPPWSGYSHAWWWTPPCGCPVRSCWHFPTSMKREGPAGGARGSGQEGGMTGAPDAGNQGCEYFYDQLLLHHI